MESGTYQILVTFLIQIQIKAYSYETNVLKLKLTKYVKLLQIIFILLLER